MFFNENVAGLWSRGCNGNSDNVIVHPTERVVNTRTNKTIVRNIYPTEVINVKRTIVRNEHFYPVNEREVNDTIVIIDVEEIAHFVGSQE
ncbi:CotD family spore coat protein [Bacillus sp. FJAT-50079]|uniref:CotD family spore coat protein n=1 Tax=Bacillus sp. FJAT-50079 TaxID=2833577 RepID=UPI001BC967FF|nr:CotD family spore coat protein [Bacillus sp. FJAT-50079]MBS4207517.1 hypothetical protein [Bacillus sp. FJAT-50079]